MLINYLLLKTNLFPKTSKIQLTQVLKNIETGQSSTNVKHEVKHDNLRSFLQNV